MKKKKKEQGFGLTKKQLQKQKKQQQKIRKREEKAKQRLLVREKKQQRRGHAAAVKEQRRKSVGIRRLFVCAVLFLTLLIFACILWKESYQDEKYPKGIVQKEVIQSFSKTMQGSYYMPLRQIATTLGSSGIYLIPLKEKEFNYKSDDGLLTLLCMEEENDRIIVAKGSADIEKDVLRYAIYFDDYLGKITPTYHSKVVEEGLCDDYYVMHSSGLVDAGNMLRKQPYYVTVLEYYANEGRLLCLMYVTSDLKRLERGSVILTEFASLALEGVQDTGEDKNVQQEAFGEYEQLQDVDTEHVSYHQLIDEEVEKEEEIHPEVAISENKINVLYENEEESEGMEIPLSEE